MLHFKLLKKFGEQLCNSNNTQYNLESCAQGCPELTVTRRTDQPAQSPLDFSPNRCYQRSISGFCVQGLTLASRVAGPLLQNLSHLTRRRLYTNLAKSSSNPRRSSKFSTIFGEIQPNPAIPSRFQQFWCRFWQI